MENLNTKTIEQTVTFNASPHDMGARLRPMTVLSLGPTLNWCPIPRLCRRGVPRMKDGLQTITLQQALRSKKQTVAPV